MGARASVRVARAKLPPIPRRAVAMDATACSLGIDIPPEHAQEFQRVVERHGGSVSRWYAAAGAED
eukprot:8744837-Lingulodinium_polyedra.AAC.1